MFREYKGSHKKTYQTLDIVQIWGGGQRCSQTFYQKQVWTCDGGGGGVWLKVLVQSSFLQKSMYSRSMKSFFVLNWSIHVSKHMKYQPKPYQKKITFWLIRNWFYNFKLFVSKCSNYFRGGGLNQVWASKFFASIPA